MMSITMLYVIYVIIRGLFLLLLDKHHIGKLLDAYSMTSYCRFRHLVTSSCANSSCPLSNDPFWKAPIRPHAGNQSLFVVSATTHAFFAHRSRIKRTTAAAVLIAEAS